MAAAVTLSPRFTVNQLQIKGKEECVMQLVTGSVSGAILFQSLSTTLPVIQQSPVVTAAEKDRIMKENCCRYMLVQMWITGQV